MDALCVTILAARVGFGRGKYISDCKSLQKATNVSDVHQTERGCTRRIKEVENFFFRFAFKSNFTLIPINVSEHERGALLTSG